MTITTKNHKSKKYNVSIDLGVLEKVAGALGLFRAQFVSDIKESLKDMRAGRIVKAKSLKDL
jgi:hypothetical protein